MWQNQGDFDMLLLMMYWDKYETNPAGYHSNTTRLEMVDTGEALHSTGKFMDTFSARC